MSYYVFSTLAAIVTGFVLVTTIKPGVGAELGFKMPVEEFSKASDSFGQTLYKHHTCKYFRISDAGTDARNNLLCNYFRFFYNKSG